MIVYGDHPRPTTLGALEAEAAARLEAARATLPGLARHAALVAAFIAAAEVVRARADLDFAVCGHDRRVAEVEQGMAALVRVARAVRVSWRTRFRRTPVPCSRVVAPDPRPVTTKPAEGFAFYALYPEAVLDALSPPLRSGGDVRAADGGGGPDIGLVIVGVRGIGTALAALAAAATRIRRVPITLRPVGHPFARELAVDGARAGDLAGATRALVTDEGPGLSGSSFAAVVGWLGANGIPPGRVQLLTSHDGPPGARASASTRALFRACPRLSAGFEASIAPHLWAWVVDLLGEPLTGWRELSGGAWADAATPTDSARERRKFLVTAASGRYLVKFAGLAAIGDAKLVRARALDGFAPPPVGVVHGFLVERWIEGRAAMPSPAEAAAYLDARAALPTGSGASLADLIAMACANIGEALGPQAESVFTTRIAGGERLPSRPVAVDGRLHAWEWVRDADGRVWKTDALDHCEGHDLIGHQDIAWDVAGATIELGLDPAHLARVTGADPRLVVLHGLLYPAFQLGLWTKAGHPRADFYAEWLRGALSAGPPPAASGR